MKNKPSIKLMMQITLLASIGAILMYWQIPYPGAPWLKVDISDVPVLIGGFALGPWIGLLVLLMKNLVFSLIKFNAQELVGIPMNTIATGIMVLVSGYVYGRKKTYSNAVTALFSGIVTSIVLMIPVNYIMVPIFVRLFLPAAPIPSSSRLMEIIIITIVPFNALKGALNGIVTFLTYKRFANLIRPQGEMEIIPVAKIDTKTKSQANY